MVYCMIIYNSLEERIMLGTEKKVRALHDLNRNEDSQNDFDSEETLKREGDGNSPALWVSFIAVIVVMVAYFAVDSKLGALTETVRTLPALETKVGAMETDLAKLKDLPTTVKNMFISDQMAQLSLMMSRLSANLESEDQKAVALKAEELMRQLQGMLAPATAGSSAAQTTQQAPAQAPGQASAQ